MRINIKKEGNKKQRFSILFFSNLPHNNVGRSVSQSAIKKAFISIGTLNRTVNSSVNIPFDFKFFICENQSVHVIINTKHEMVTISPTLPKKDRAGLLLM